jgi:hypothetical protein
MTFSVNVIRPVTTDSLVFTFILNSILKLKFRAKASECWRMLKNEHERIVCTVGPNLYRIRVRSCSFAFVRVHGRKRTLIWYINDYIICDDIRFIAVRFIYFFFLSCGFLLGLFSVFRWATHTFNIRQYFNENNCKKICNFLIKINLINTI